MGITAAFLFNIFITKWNKGTNSNGLNLKCLLQLSSIIQRQGKPREFNSHRRVKRNMIFHDRQDELNLQACEHENLNQWSD